MGTFANFSLNTGCFTSETASQLQDLLDGTLASFIPQPTFITPAGTDQATATQVQSAASYVEEGSPGGGIMLPPITDVGEKWFIQNESAFTLFVYPPPGVSIDNGTPNEPCTIIPYGSGEFAAESATEYNTSVDPVRGTGGILVQHQFGGLVVQADLPALQQVLMPYQVDVPTAPGYTINIANNVTMELIYQEGGAPNSSGVTINFPPTPYVQQRLVIATVSGISGMTLQPGYQIGGAPTSMAANSSIEFVWLSGRWNRLR